MSNITLEEFNTNFMTHIRGFEEGHLDETGQYDYGVGFNVVCKNNSRVEYFESHLSSNILPSNYNSNDIIDAAWSNVLPDVKTWASTVIYSSNILGSSFIPSVSLDSNLDFSTTSNFYYDTFSSNYDVKVNRMETYPANNPSSWFVGFFVSKSNDPSVVFHMDTRLTVNTFAIFRAEQEILDMAWSNVKEEIGKWAQTHYFVNPIINSSFSTSNW